MVSETVYFPMVFEDVTALELHVHTGEPDPMASPSRPESTVEESGDSSSGQSTVLLVAVAVLASLVVSALVAVLIRRIRS